MVISVGEWKMNNNNEFQPFNSPLEVGFRALALLTEDYPVCYSLQRLVILDYLIVHSDDLSHGPKGLHPKTPHRGGELLVRRAALEKGLLLYQSKGLLERHFREDGVLYSANERSASFLDVLTTNYIVRLRGRAEWLVQEFSDHSDYELSNLVKREAGEWGAEFEMSSALKKGIE